jgi:hypothetical protein
MNPGLACPGELSDANLDRVVFLKPDIVLVKPCNLVGQPITRLMLI